MSNSLGGIVAHQGGWDEAVFVLVPIAIFAVLLALANRRAAAAMTNDPVHLDAPDVEPEPDAVNDDPEDHSPSRERR